MFAGKSYSEKAKKAYVPIREFVDVNRISLGKNTSTILHVDPKLFLFTLAKYKFAAKMLEGKDVIELGCMDGGGTILLSNMVSSVVAIDFYEDHIKDCLRIKEQGFFNNVDFYHRNILDENADFKNRFDGAICFDVLEHLDPKDSSFFFEKCKSYLNPNGIFIGGVPSIESQLYASEVNKESHINCMEFKELISLANKSFKNVLPFGMNDEIIHTGYRKMCHYNIVVCSFPR